MCAKFCCNKYLKISLDNIETHGQRRITMNNPLLQRNKKELNSKERGIISKKDNGITNT